MYKLQCSGVFRVRIPVQFFAFPVALSQVASLGTDPAVLHPVEPSEPECPQRAGRAHVF